MVEVLELELAMAVTNSGKVGRVLLVYGSNPLPQSAGSSRPTGMPRRPLQAQLDLGVGFGFGEPRPRRLCVRAHVVSLAT